MGVALAAVAVAQVIGGEMGRQAAAGDRDAQRRLAGEAYQRLKDLGMPPDTAQPLILKQFNQAGILTPEMEQTIKAGPSAVAGITEDPALKERQMSALNLISQRATGGLNAQDRANFNEMRNQLASDQEAKQQQIMQQYQQRGMGGSGSELAAALMGQQSGANQAASAGDRLAATASQNAMQAALQSGQLGGQIRQQDFDVNKAKASAADEMNRFNVTNQQGQQSRNVSAANQAQLGNLNLAQGTQNANTSMGNAELARQNEAKVSDWKNKVGLAQVQAGGANTMSDVAGRQADATANRYAQMAGGIGTAIGAMYGSSAPKSSGSVTAGEPDVSIYGENDGGYSGQGGQYKAYGGLIPGKASVSGDNYKNDTVVTHLSPGEMVIPRSIMESNNAPEHAATFVAMMKRISKESK